MPFAAVFALPRLFLDAAAEDAAEGVNRAAEELRTSWPPAAAPFHPHAAPIPLPPLAEAAAIEAVGEPQPVPSGGEPLLDLNAPDPPPESPAAPPVAPRHEPHSTSSVFVRRQRVSAAVRAGHQPSGSFVPATAERPAGLALSGVGGFGIGVRDGDVLTHVGGAPARSVGSVIGAVKAAVRAGHPAISAEVWRGGHRIIVTAELPRSDPAGADAPAPAPR